VFAVTRPAQQPALGQLLHDGTDRQTLRTHPGDRTVLRRWVHVIVLKVVEQPQCVFDRQTTQLAPFVPQLLLLHELVVAVVHHHGRYERALVVAFTAGCTLLIRLFTVTHRTDAITFQKLGRAALASQ